MLNLPEFFTKHRRRIAIAVVVILFAIIAVNVFVYWYFPRYVNPRTPADTIDTLQTSIQITSIVVSLIGSVLLIGTVITALGSISQTQQSLELNREQLRVAQESQITERFTKAIEQLGSDNLAIRLGGIYALERIAKDSPRDHWTVMEVLTAFVRENSPISNNDEDKPKPENPMTDIQAILTVIGRRSAEHRREETDFIDLSNTDLRGADLGDAVFDNAYFVGANLTRARLVRASFQETTFLFANLSYAWLANADLTSALFSLTDLTGAHLDEAILDRTRFFEPTVVKTIWQDAKFSETLLYDVDLTESKGLTQEQLDQAIIEGNTKLPVIDPI